MTWIKLLNGVLLPPKFCRDNDEREWFGGGSDGIKE